MSPLFHQEKKVVDILKRVYVYMSDRQMENVTDEVRQFVDIIEIGVVLNQQGCQQDGVLSSRGCLRRVLRESYVYAWRLRRRF